MSEESQPADLLRQGIAAVKAGRKEEAHDTLLEVVRLDERNEQAWLWLSAVVDTDEERQICLENVLAINPANARAQAGLEWLQQNSSEPVAAAVSEAVAEEPPPEAPAPEEEPCPRCGASASTSSAACASCGLPFIVACPKCGEYAGIQDRACPNCGQALPDFRDGVAYNLALADLYLENHLTDRAQEALDRAEAEADGDADVLAQVGGRYESAGLRARALIAYERAVEAAPRDPALHARLGAAYRQHGDRARSAAMYEKAAELGSQDPAVACELARMDLEAGAAQKAVSRLQPLVRKQPVDPRVMLMMGDSLQKLGDSEAAVAHYRRVAQVAPSDSEVGGEARTKLAQLGAVPGRSERSAARAAAGERPGCVTLYALLSIAAALLSMVGAVGFAAVYSRGSLALQQALQQRGLDVIDLEVLTPFVGVALILAFFSALANMIIGVGLWARKNWARLAVVALTTIAFAGGLVQVTRTTAAFREAMGGSGFGLPAPVLAGLLITFALQAVVIFWFLVNRDVFE